MAKEADSNKKMADSSQRNQLSMQSERLFCVRPVVTVIYY